MKWTTSKPTRDGWYWAQDPGEKTPFVVYCCKIGHLETAWLGDNQLDRDKIECWSDQPIPEPKP